MLRLRYSLLLLNFEMGQAGRRFAISEKLLACQFGAIKFYPR